MFHNLELDKIITIATRGITRQVSYTILSGGRRLYCYKHHLPNNLLFIITDNLDDLITYIFNVFLNRDAKITKNMLYFRACFVEPEQHTSTIPFKCYPGMSDCWCNRKILCESLVEWLLDNICDHRVRELKEAIDKNKSFVVYGDEILNYVTYEYDGQINNTWFILDD